MAIVSEVEDRIYLIEPEHQENSIQCFSYIVSGEQTALIETGAASQGEELFEGMAKLGIDKSSLDYIIPTHIHMDHGAGSGYMTQQIPRVKVVLHESGFKHLVDPSRFKKIAQQVFGANLEDHFGPLIPIPESNVMVVKGGETIDRKSVV